FPSTPPSPPHTPPLSLHDALPISQGHPPPRRLDPPHRDARSRGHGDHRFRAAGTARLTQFVPVSRTGVRSPATSEFVNIRKIDRSEEHTSEFQSRGHLVCRLLLEK